MQWPSRAEYAEAVGYYPHVSFQDPSIRNGQPRRGQDGFLISDAGAFSIVFPIDLVSTTFALRCWIKDVNDAENRYRRISVHLRQVNLPYFVDFEYVSEGILINGITYPITRMEWAEGVSLRKFIEQNLQNPHIFRIVADEFQKMVVTLHDHRISHGDLQDGNILIKQNGTRVELKLIDYDSLFVPTLQGQTEQIVGLPEYQHPERIAGGGQANEKVDYFSELVIYLSFLSLAERPELWNMFGGETDPGLLFSKTDFENPDESDVFQELETLSRDVQHLTETLKDFCAQTSIDGLEPLEGVLPRSDADTYCNQGDSFRNNRQYNEALAEYQRAITLAPDCARAFFGCGHVYRCTNRYTDAIDAFRQATNFNRNYQEAYYGLGVTYYESGDNSSARIELNEALRIDPNYQPARELLNAIRPIPPVPPPQPPDRRPNPIPPIPDSTSPIPNTDRLKWITGFLGIALVVCLMVIVALNIEKNETLREVNRLKSLLNEASLENQQLIGESQVKDEEIQRLKSELAEKDEEIQRLKRLIGPQPETTNITLIPAGEFRMGSNASYSDEGPVHTVYVDAFYIDKYEVTNREYKEFVVANPQWGKTLIHDRHHDGNYLKHWTGNRYPYGKGNYPVTWVSWYAAMAYAQWKGKRLPTEAEWEKAARGGLGINDYLRNNLVNSATANYNRHVGQTTPVGTYQANSYGLYDIVGNVSEWCLDAYNSRFYTNSPRQNPISGGSINFIVSRFGNLVSDRVLRGGSWISTEDTATLTYRVRSSPAQTTATFGFRCVSVNP